MKYVPIVRRVMNLCTSIVSQDVALDVANPNGDYTWWQISGINRTGVTTTIEVGLKRGNEFYCFRAGAAAAVDRSIRVFGEACAPPGFVPCARFKVAAVGDELELVVSGCVGDR